MQRDSNESEQFPKPSGNNTNSAARSNTATYLLIWQLRRQKQTMQQRQRAAAR
jgi:hypothetical protein